MEAVKPNPCPPAKMNLTQDTPPMEAGPTNVVMVGMMGCGKSAIGRKLADSLKLSFVDTDALIVEEAGRSIPEIFADESETGFRRRERRVLTQLQDVRDHVIATGGGIVVSAENRALLRSLGYVAWLTASIETLLFRVSQNRERPLMRTEDPRGRLVDLLEQRKGSYKEVADIVVDTSDLTMCETVHGLVESINYHFGCRL